MKIIIQMTTYMLIIALFGCFANSEALGKNKMKTDSFPKNLETTESPMPWGDTFLPKSNKPAQRILCVDARGLAPEIRTALSCLQGLTSRERPVIWLNMSNRDP